MALQIGIVGLPNVGKSTLFKALTKKQVDCANYPFCTIDPNVGVVAVPDERLQKLADFSKTKKIVPATIEFVDIAGLVKGASQGEGLGNKFLSHIRETDAIAEVVRIFEDPNIIHVESRINPLSDIEVINTELILADLDSVTKQIERAQRNTRTGNKDAILELGALTKIQDALKKGILASSIEFSEAEKPFIKSFGLLTIKPILYVLNKKSGAVNLDEINDERYVKLIEFFEKNGNIWTTVDAKIEQELNELSEEEKIEYKKELGVKDDGGINQLIHKGYELLGLITYFTTGETETRAWTIPKNSAAPRAGRAIHSDFEEKFIRAEVIFWQDLLNTGSFAAARDKGLLRTEGKEYIVKDGDVMEFKV
ncbi:MAG: translation-associated GTPase [Parcubacteria group bacterium GW2011_GWD2_38_12]|nr:MAG: translation-associated GTPase [Parcubacteria group bacterium GW2011_GWD2_38_12]